MKVSADALVRQKNIELLRRLLTHRTPVLTVCGNAGGDVPFD